VAGRLKVPWTSVGQEPNIRIQVALGKARPGARSSRQPLALAMVGDEASELCTGIAAHLSQVAPYQALVRLAKPTIAELVEGGLYEDSKTSSDCICRHLSMRWCSAATRRVKFRPWTVLSLGCR